MYNHAEKNTLHLFRIGIELGKRSLNGEKTQIGVSQRRKKFMIKVGIIGATGYAGGELVRLLLGHKEAEDRVVWFQKLCGSELCIDLSEHVSAGGCKVYG